MKTYKGKISDLPNNAIAVIGSNEVGINGNPTKGTGGAMLFALNKGWVRQGEKVNNRFSECGRMFGLCTVTYPGKKRSKTPEQIKEGIRILYSQAILYPEFDYCVFYTAGKRNLNGYTDLEMAGMFAAFEIPKNIVFEEEFSRMILK